MKVPAPPAPFLESVVCTPWVRQDSRCAFFRLAIPIIASRPVPNSQALAASGTGSTSPSAKRVKFEGSETTAPVPGSRNRPDTVRAANATHLFDHPIIFIAFPPRVQCAKRHPRQEVRAIAAPCYCFYGAKISAASLDVREVKLTQRVQGCRFNTES